MSATHEAPRLPPTFNRLAWSNLAAQLAEQIALAAAPIVAVILLGVAAIAARGQCANRTGAHRCLCQWTGAGRRAGGLGWRCAGVWLRRGAVRDCSGAASRDL